MQSKLHFARVSWSFASHWKILLFSRTKRRKPQRCTWEWHLKNKRKTNMLLCMTRISRCLQHTFSSSLQLKKENYFLRSLELDSWLSSKLKKTTKIYLTIYLVIISSSYLLTLLQFQHGRQNLSFDVRPLRSRTCDVTFGFEITSGCRSWGQKCLMVKGARSRCFRWFCFILLVMSSKRQIGRARVFHFQNHGHITTENDFPAV